MKQKTIIKNGTVLINEKLVPCSILIEDGKIIDFITDDIPCNDYEIINGSNYYILPGFIDVHTHGGNGIDVNLASKADIVHLTEFFASKGVTGFLPTVLTDTYEEMGNIVSTINQARKEDTLGAKILGIHLEGPFLSKEYKGAMPEQLIIDASLDKLRDWIDKSEDTIKTITIAPENAKDIIDFIQYAVSKNIVVSLGHTGAPYELCMKCIEAGANRATHTFNGMSHLHQHRPSILGASLESDIYVEAICDGFHLHEAIVRLMIKAKGVDKVIAVTDSVMAAGLPDGKYKLGVNDIIVENSDARLATTNVRAGSTLTMDRALKNIMAFTKRPMEECVKFMTINPARMLNIEDKKGSLVMGKDADIVLMDKDLNVKLTMVEGKVVYNDLSTK